MSFILQVDFPYNGPWGAQMEQAMRELASSIAQEPGLLWKIWTENPDTNEAGGIYLFADESSAHNYLHMHTQRLNELGIQPINAKVFQVNDGLSQLNKAPIQP